jgi:hypothetical protein
MMEYNYWVLTELSIILDKSIYYYFFILRLKYGSSIIDI